MKTPRNTIYQYIYRKTHERLSGNCSYNCHTKLSQSTSTLPQLTVNDFLIAATYDTSTYSATVEIVLGLLAFLIVIAIVLALIYYCYKRKLRLEAEALKAKQEQDERERLEREKRERIRMEKGALTPTLDLGFPDESVYDITRLFYDDEEPVTPTKVETDINERLLDQDNEVTPPQLYG